MSPLKPSFVPYLFLAFVAASGCGGTTTGNPAIDSSASEVAAATLSGAANSTEPNGTQAYFQTIPTKAYFAEWLNALSPVHSSFAANACPTIKTGSCSSGTLLMTYSGCSFGSSATIWNGSQSLLFSGSCGTISLAALSGQTLIRTFGTGTTETNASGIVTQIDTANAATSGWDSSVTGLGQGTQAVFTGATDGSRTLTILGLHLRGTSSGGTVLYDHTVSSTGIAVTGAGTSRSISSGTITVQHNLAKFTAKAQITTALTYGLANCCHPSAGVITSTLTGSKNGSETVTFTGGSTGTCGSATVVNNAGVSSTVTLNHCF